MAYSIGDNGRYSIPLVDFGTRLRDNFGLDIGEHSEFGGNSGGHAPNSYHNYDEAIDIRDWREDDIDGVSWQDRTSRLKSLLGGSGAEVLGPGDEGHTTHVHLAATGGNLSFTPEQFQYFYGGNAGGKSSTFAPLAMASDTPQAEAKAKAVAYKDMSASQMNAAYDQLRAGDDQAKAASEGMKMHKAFFNK